MFLFFALFFAFPLASPAQVKNQYLKYIDRGSTAVLCLCLTRPGRPTIFSFSKILEVVSRPEFAQDHESGLRFDRGPVVLCDFAKLRF